MAIYKLVEIGKLKGGISNLDKNRYNKGIYFVNYMDVFNNFFIKKLSKFKLYDANSKEFEKYNLKYGDVLFTASSETPDEICISSVFLSNEKAIFNGFCKRYRFNHKILIPKYAGFLFRAKNFRMKAYINATGYTRYNISQKDISEIKVEIPSLIIQKKIIDIIEPVENLFLKYSKCVRIDNFENTKNDIKNLIDIIEPVENLFLKYSKCVRIDNFENVKNDIKNLIDIIEPINQSIQLSTNILNKISNLYKLLQLNSKNNKIKNIIKEHSNGYAYKKINIDNSGKYKIFKIKNISTENSFDKTNFLKNNFLLNGDVLTGLTGTLGTAKIIVDKNWVNNQRTLMLRSSFFLEIKATIENSIDLLMKNAKGAVQKNISHNDILNLKINIHCYNKTLSDLYLLSSDIKQKLLLIQTKLINLLIK